jgi:hypothetical protein
MTAHDLTGLLAHFTCAAPHAIAIEEPPDGLIAYGELPVLSDWLRDRLRTSACNAATASGSTWGSRSTPLPRPAAFTRARHARARAHLSPLQRDRAGPVLPFAP